MPWSHVLLSLPPHALGESSIIIQMSTAPNDNREENKTEEMKKQYYKLGSPAMNLFKVSWLNKNVFRGVK